MSLMAKKKPKPKTRTRYVRLPEVLDASLERVSEKSRRAFSVELAIAIEEYLERLGEWPPTKEKS